ncbi:hypothetical protein C2S53_020933 [Perilla frutescens var. hirtella]|uniref:Morc S5 domain-containing protein n=1 Tax=Perilla frutescens var. hirtella TaxID=608512 RepID=A0AAD4IXZ7_PERFH|nr:hypothetical protein C2S53_020933 [Perilla frutescens var. hirtella]
MDSYMKQETVEAVERLPQRKNRISRDVISLSSSSSDFSFGGSDNEESNVELNPTKKRRVESVLPVGFLDPIRQPASQKRTMNCADAGKSIVRVKLENIENVKHVSKKVLAAVDNRREAAVTTVALLPSCKQFWKAGDYEGGGDGGKLYDDEMDHVRVHPKFLHSNATSHKWSLGAFAELLDNALDEKCNGATFVDVDVLENTKDNTKMVLVQDDGGGMTPDKMRQCMSLGYSAKSKIANMIGQYGNGFKTSTMRLGADVIVFSRCEGKYGGRSTQSIGLLSYTFLRSTGKEDIVVPMIDYERKGQFWSKCVKSTPDSWQRNLETIVEWSPYETEKHLLEQFDLLNEKGTRIIIYNLWDNDEGKLELDFDSDPHDIQIRGDDRDEKKIEMAKKYSSSRHFLTYRHSLRSYASILYRRMPPDFHIMLRGKAVDHHDIVSDMIHKTEHVYKPAAHPDMPSKDPNISATLILGFVKDAHHHIDIQGFNVYHKNRLIKPFWRLWNASGSDGRGVIGVLEANFIEPAHDKQGFERTVALSRLENRLIHFQKTYWSTKCQLIGYAQRRGLKKSVSPDKSNVQVKPSPSSCRNRSTNGKTVKSSRENELRAASEAHDQPQFAAAADDDDVSRPESKSPSHDIAVANVHVKAQGSDGDEKNSYPSITNMVLKLKQENDSLRDGLRRAIQDVQYERDRYNSLENELEHTKKMMASMDQEQETFVNVFAEERGRREREEERLRGKLKEASETIEALLAKMKILEAAKRN